MHCTVPLSAVNYNCFDCSCHSVGTLLSFDVFKSTTSSKMLIILLILIFLLISIIHLYTFQEPNRQQQNPNMCNISNQHTPSCLLVHTYQT